MSKATPATKAATTAVSAPVVTPALTDGAYFVDDRLNRSDIRSGLVTGAVKEGSPLQVTPRVWQVSGAGCPLLQGAMADVWYCNTLEVYSDVDDPQIDTRGQKFLRGYQVTNANGTVQFIIVYLGWYQGTRFTFPSKSGAQPARSRATTSPRNPSWTRAWLLRSTRKRQPPARGADDA